MRIKFRGVTRKEADLLQLVNPLSLYDTVVLLQKPNRTPFETELVIKSLKANVCQHIRNRELGRPTMSHLELTHRIELLRYANGVLGFEVYAEYLDESAKRHSNAGKSMHNNIPVDHNMNGVSREKLMYC